MDLNRLYFQHQLSLMRAASAADRKAQAGHHAEANGLACQISRFQQAIRASAAAGWNVPAISAATCGGAL